MTTVFFIFIVRPTTLPRHEYARLCGRLGPALQPTDHRNHHEPGIPLQFATFRRRIAQFRPSLTSYRENEMLKTRPIPHKLQFPARRPGAEAQPALLSYQ
jgi:hypothetical protein